MEVRVEVGPEFGEFVRANTAALLRTGYLLTGNAGAAEELVQDTLVRLYPKWDKVQAADQPLAYVRRSLTNGFINERRKASSHELRFDLMPDRPDERDATRSIADRDELWPLLKTLPARQRAAIVLRYYHDLSDDQIAAALECRGGTVRSLISRGLATMRQAADGAPAAGRPA